MTDEREETERDLRWDDGSGAWLDDDGAHPEARRVRRTVVAPASERAGAFEELVVQIASNPNLGHSVVSSSWRFSWEPEGRVLMVPGTKRLKPRRTGKLAGTMATLSSLGFTATLVERLDGPEGETAGLLLAPELPIPLLEDWEAFMSVGEPVEGAYYVTEETNSDGATSFSLLKVLRVDDRGVHVRLTTTAFPRCPRTLIPTI